MQKKEERQFGRLGAYHLVKYKAVTQEGEESAPVLATIKDIGTGGVCLRSEEYLPVSTTIELKINFPHLSTPIFALGKVIWIKQRKKGKFYEIGVQFFEIEESMRKIIDEQTKSVYRRLKEGSDLFKELLKKDIFKVLFKRRAKDE